MRWLLEQQLGYRYTHPFELKNTGGATLYHMIFATDNDAGTTIMTSIYSAAAKTVPQMQQEARDRAKGQQTLAFDVEVRAPDLGITTRPRGSRARTRRATPKRSRL